MLLYADQRFLDHDTGHHPENANRLRSIRARLEKAALVQQCTSRSFEPLTAEAVSRLHDPTVAARLWQVAQAGGGHLDADTVVSPQSYAVALLAAGACCAAVDEVLSGPDRRALCLVRPPGHHATTHRSMGFCLLNNVALAAHRARTLHGLERILIVDWDVHHGNGTQDIFFADPSVMFLSIHRYGHGFYPGTGAADETGTGPGLGFTLNIPLPYGTPRRAYLGAFKNALERAAAKIRPELILLSAGFDAHRRDPIGSLSLESEDFGEMTQFLLDVAGVHAGGRLVSCLEGGYDLEALAESVQIHVEEMLRPAGEVAAT
ncbi:MAG: histone deacetylase [Gemmataceae bacterium]|nr:histone deacetylase [Gemmataceae bacterium]